jgi:hypothetical protein
MCIEIQRTAFSVCVLLQYLLHKQRYYNCTFCSDHNVHAVLSHDTSCKICLLVLALQILFTVNLFVKLFNDDDSDAREISIVRQPKARVFGAPIQSDWYTYVHIHLCTHFSTSLTVHARWTWLYTRTHSFVTLVSWLCGTEMTNRFRRLSHKLSHCLGNRKSAMLGFKCHCKWTFTTTHVQHNYVATVHSHESN